MKKTKRVLAMALVVVMLMSVMGIAANAATVPTTKTNYGYMLPTDAKGTKTVSTVKLYGNYDYIDFYINSRYADMYFFYEIYSSKNYTEKSLIDGGYFYCGAKGTYSGSTLLKLSGVYKSGTYYAVTYAAKISASGSVSLSEPSLREFKIVVDRTTAFKKQMVINKTVKNTVNGPQITWQGVSGATKYYVYRRPMTGTTWTKVGTAKSSARSFVDTTVKNKNGKFVYTVKAINKSGAATRYHYAGLDCLFAKAPVIKSVATGADNKIKVQWNNTSSSAYYEVYRREVGTSSWTKLAGNYKKTYYNDAKAVSGKTYEYTVRANIKTADGLARSAYYGNADKAVKYLQAPKINYIKAAVNGLALSWNQVDGATAYTIYRRPIDGSAGWSVIEKVSSDTSTYFDTTGSYEGGYIYTVRTEGPKGRGSYYTAGEAYFVPDKPQAEIEVNPETGAVMLSWNEVPYAQSYDVYCMNEDGDEHIEYEDVSDCSVQVYPDFEYNTYVVEAKIVFNDTMSGETFSFNSRSTRVTAEIE